MLGRTLTIFIILGTLPCSKDIFTNLETGSEISLENCLKTIELIPSALELVKGFNESITFMILSGHVGVIKMFYFLDGLSKCGIL